MINVLENKLFRKTENILSIIKDLES